MDPIDFTKPEAFGQSAARAPGEMDGTSEAGQPNSEARQRLYRALGSALRWSVYALIVWSIGTALLALSLQQAQPGASALKWPFESPFDWPLLLARVQEPAVLTQMADLAWMTLDLVYLPVFVFAVFVWLPMPLMAIKKRMEAPGGALLGQLELPLLALLLLKFAAIAFTVIAAGCVARAAWAVAEGDDPLEILPGVTPPYLREFLARHPALSAESDSSIGYVSLHDGQGHALRLHRTELEGAQARFEACPAVLGAAQLGSIAPYPQAPCATLLRLRKAKEEQVHYVFEIPGDSDSAAIKAHFVKWVEEHAAASASTSRKGGSFSLGAGSRDGAWHLDVNSSNGGATTIVIRHTSSPTR